MSKFRGFSEEELTIVFNRIKNPEDWKAPIICKCHIGQVAVVLASLVYFHEVEGKVIGIEPESGWRVIRSEGYQKREEAVK